MVIRLHITLDNTLVQELDDQVGPRQRSSFIAAAVRRALEQERSWKLIESAIGSVGDEGHSWDDDSAKWVHEQRRSDSARAG